MDKVLGLGAIAACRRALAGLGVAVVVASIGVGCTSEVEQAPVSQVTTADPYKQARADNLNRHVLDSFPQHPVVLAEEDNSGVETSQLFFDASETVVLADTSEQAQLRAASVAVVAHAPMLTLTDGNRKQVIAEVQRLGARHVLAVGKVDLASQDGELTVIKDPGTDEALAQITAMQFERTTVLKRDDMVQAVADLGPDDPILLVPGWLGKDPPTTTAAAADTAEDDAAEPQEVTATTEATATTEPTTTKNLKAFPVQSRRDADVAPIVIASAESPLAAVATVRAYGASVRMLDYPDPRFNRSTMEAVAGLADEPLVALGAQFGTSSQLSEKIRMGEQATYQFPGGGLVLAQRSLSTQVLPFDATSATEALAAAGGVTGSRYPAVAVLGSTATQGPGATNTYSKTADAAEVELVAQEIQSNNAFGFVVLQPGAADPVEQVEDFNEALKNPNVGLVLDASQARKEDGSQGTTAEQVSKLAAWLAEFVSEHALPQKAFVVLQSEGDQIQDLDSVSTDAIELAYVLGWRNYGNVFEATTYAEVTGMEGWLPGYWGPEGNLAWQATPNAAVVFAS